MSELFRHTWYPDTDIPAGDTLGKSKGPPKEILPVTMFGEYEKIDEHVLDLLSPNWYEVVTRVGR